MAQEFNVDAADSPASFPCSPYSRSVIMNRTVEKVDTVLFAARDRLRLVHSILCYLTIERHGERVFLVL